MATAVFRVEKNKNFTVISNYHLQDKKLSLKAKGLLTLILSLPEGWDMSLNGLVSLSGDGTDATRSAIAELEKSGYLLRSRHRDELGRMLVTEYQVYEVPPAEQEKENENVNVISESHIGKSDADKTVRVGKPDTDATAHIGKSDADKQKAEPVHMGFSIGGKPDAIKYLNNKVLNSSMLIPSINHDKIYGKDYKAKPDDRIDEIEKAQTLYNERKAYEEIIKQNISYDILPEQNKISRDFLDLCVQIMVDAVTSTKPFIKIKGQDIPQAVVKSVMLKLNEDNIAYVDMCLSQSKTAVRNMQSYILTALYCSLYGSDSYYEQLVKHEYG